MCLNNVDFLNANTPGLQLILLCEIQQSPGGGFGNAGESRESSCPVISHKNMSEHLPSMQRGKLQLQIKI